MQIKDLHKLRKIKEHLKSYERKITELRSTIENITSDTTKEYIKGSGDKQDLVIKLIELESEYQNKVLELYTNRRIVEEQIELMDCLGHPAEIEQQKLFLNLRYVDCLTLEQAAVDMNLSYRWICTIRKKAEKNFEKLHMSS